MFLNQVWLHGNEQVTHGTVSRLHLPHEVLHAELCATFGKTFAVRERTFLVLAASIQTKLLLTPGEVLVFVRLTDGSRVVIHVLDPLCGLLNFVLQILLENSN